MQWHTLRKYQLAFYTKPVAIGDVIPDDEAAFDGYERVTFLGVTPNLNGIYFPGDWRNSTIPIIYAAALDENETVVAVMGLAKNNFFLGEETKS